MRCVPQDIDDATLLRFLRARSMDVSKSAKLFADHQKWRREYFPLGHAQEGEIKDEIAARKYFMQGRDKQGRPLCVFLGANESCSKNIDQYKREFLLIHTQCIVLMQSAD